MAVLVRAVKALPDADPGRIRFFRRAVRSGGYVVDPAKVAGKMVDELIGYARAG